jgi:hypothetical protein
MAKSAEVAVKGNTAVVLAMNFEGDAQSGFEQMDQDDFALPFLRILTNMSPEIGEVDGASPGMIYNSVTGELFDGKKGVQVYSLHVHSPVYRMGTTWIRQRWTAEHLSRNK